MIELPKRARRIEGQRFGRLVVEAPARIDRWAQVIWLCRCDCGGQIEARGKHLWSGGTKSCGCFRREHSSFMNLRHGHARSGRVTRTHQSWNSMVGRCTNPRDGRYRDYGGRGIKVCDRWMVFEEFLKDMGERPPGLTLERKDNNAGYSPENCKWATRKEQANNTRRNRVLEFCGERLSVAQWSERLSLNPENVYIRLKNGWSTPDALSPPMDSKFKPGYKK